MPRATKSKASPLESNGSAKPQRAYPEIVTGDTDWDVTYAEPGSYHGLTNNGAHTMMVPSEASPEGRFVRVHEMAHAKFSPVKVDCLYRKRRVDSDSLQACEDARLHEILHRTPYTAAILAGSCISDAMAPEANLVVETVAMLLLAGEDRKLASFLMASRYTGDGPALEGLIAKWKGKRSRRMRRTLWWARLGLRLAPRHHAMARRAAYIIDHLDTGIFSRILETLMMMAGIGEGAGAEGKGEAQPGEGEGEAKPSDPDAPVAYGNGADSGPAEAKVHHKQRVKVKPGDQAMVRAIDAAVERAKAQKRSAAAKRGAVTRAKNKAAQAQAKKVAYKLETLNRLRADVGLDPLTALLPTCTAPVKRWSDNGEATRLVDGLALHYAPTNPAHPVEWGPMFEARPTRNVVVTSESPRPTPSGLVPRHIARVRTNGRVFSRKRVLDRARPGAVLVDMSGSMDLSDEDVQKVLDHAPFATIAGYAGAHAWGGLVLLAKNGRRVESLAAARREMEARGGEATYEGETGRSIPKGENTLLGAWHGNNTVDGPALEWLCEQPGPRYWISDGHVIGIGPNKTSTAILEDAAQIVARGRITRFDTITDALKGLR